MRYSYHDQSLPLIIVIGGGFAGLELVKKLNNKPYRVLLLDKHNYFTFQPLLYQIAAGGLSADSIAYPYRRKIGGYPNISFRLATVTSISPELNTVHTNVGDFIYDHLVIAAGACTNFFNNAELEKNTLPLKSIPDALDMRSFILQEFENALVTENAAAQEKILNFIIVGGGPTGVELSGALAEIKKNVIPSDYTELQKERMDVHLIEGSERLLNGMSNKSSLLAKKYLEKLGVKIALNTLVKNYDGNELTLSDGTSIQTKNVIWTAGVKGAVISGIKPESIARGNRYLVDGFNKVAGYENIYAIGDIALMQADAEYPNGHPGVAQVAIQQARNIAANFIRSAKNKNPASFHYKNKGSMATIGRHKAVVDLPFISFGGYLAWYIWMFVHLMTLVGFRNRFMVFINWMWNYFTYDRAIRLIIRPYIKE